MDNWWRYNELKEIVRHSRETPGHLIVDYATVEATR